MPVKTVTIQVNALTDKANADIRATGKYFDDLRAKNPVELRVKLDAAQAIAESKILAREMAQTVRDTVKLEADKGGGLGRLIGGASGGGGLLGLILGGAGPGAAGGGAAAGGIGGTGALIGIAALATGIGGIVPALVAAGAAVASFGALAIPTFTAITGAISGVSAANAKFSEAAQNVDIAIKTSAADAKIYQANLAALPPRLREAEKLLGDTSVTWQGLTARQQANVIALSQNDAALKTMLPAQRTALDQLLASKAVWDQLSPAQQKVAIGWQHLSAAYQNLVQALAPDVLAVFNSGLKIANALLPTLLPLAQQAAHAFEGIASGMAKFFQTTTAGPGPGWKPGEQLTKTLTPFGEFMKQITALSGPTLATIGEGLGKIAIAVGKLLIAMQSPDALKILRVLLDGVALAVDLITAAFNYATPRIILHFHEMAAAFDYVRRSFAIDGHDIAVIYDAVRTASDDVTHALRAAWDATATAMASVAMAIERTFLRWNAVLAGYINDVVGFFRELPHRILNVMSGLGNDLNSFAKNALNLLLEGFKSVATDIFGWFSGFVSKILGFFTRLLHNSPTGDFYHMGRNMMEGLAMGLKDHAHLVANALTGTVVPNVGSGVARWTGVVQEALRMEGLSEGLTRQVLYQISTESGGNPNAINLTDVNAQHGDPSRGLLQTIMATFQAYHWPGTSMNIYDPLANVAAAINYARHVYGPTLMSNGSGLGSGHGYAYGGLLTEPVFGVGASGTPYMFGERGPEWIGRHGSGGGTGRVEALLEEIADRLADLTSVAGAAPARTGASLGAALAGGARTATYRALYG